MFIELKNFLFVLVWCSLLSKNFIVLVVFIGFRIWWRMYIFCRIFFLINNFFFCVLDFIILIVGKMCLLVSLWLRIILELLVFLNFLKIILFIWLFVLMRVVVIMVSDLFFLMFWVVLKNCFGCCKVFVLILLVRIFFEDGIMVL